MKPCALLFRTCHSDCAACDLTLVPCMLQGRAAEAIACYEHVALLQPESAEAHANLASCYKDAARQDTAITSYRRALQLRPDFPEAFANLVHSLQCVCEWRDRPALFQRMEAEVRTSFAKHPCRLVQGWPWQQGRLEEGCAHRHTCAASQHTGTFLMVPDLMTRAAWLIGCRCGRYQDDCSAM